jgi:hypothetical protein
VPPAQTVLAIFLKVRQVCCTGAIFFRRFFVAKDGSAYISSGIFLDNSICSRKKNLETGQISLVRGNTVKTPWWLLCGVSSWQRQRVIELDPIKIQSAVDV